MIGWLFACTGAPPVVEVRADGAELIAERPFDRVEVRDAEGIPVVRRSLPAPVERLRFDLPGGAYTAHVGEAVVAFAVPEAQPYHVEVQLAPGAPWVPLTGTLDVPTAGPAQVKVGITAGATPPESLDTSFGPVALRFPGDQVHHTLTIEAETALRVGDAQAKLRPVPFDTAALTVGTARYPVLDDGTDDLGRPAGLIPLANAGWEAVVRRVGAGIRRRDPDAPMGWLGVPLRNSGTTPLDLSVSLRFDHPAFRPRLRDADGGTDEVQVLVRVPPGSDAMVALPVFVDPEAAPEGPQDARVTVTPLGATTPVATVSSTLHVVRGDTTAQVGFGLSVLGALAGMVWTLRRVPGWLGQSPTSELMTIALFGSALFVTGTATDLLAMAVGAVLGPFSTLLTGILGDLTRVVLLGTLLGLRPRPGTLALSILTGYLLRGVALGSFAVADVIYLGAAIGMQESLAWVLGVSRGREPTFARLAVLFGVSSVGTTLVGLWLHVVLYRLYFAPWYIALQVLVPGLLYHVIASAVAARSIRALRRVQA